MHLEGFTVELLVDGQPLEEYSEPASKQATCEDKSYIRNEDTLEPQMSDKIVYAAVRDPNADFKVRFSGSTHNNSNGLLSANVHIDGKYDWTYTALARSSNNNTTTKSVSQGSFENDEEGIRKQKFKFGTKQWTEKNEVSQVGSFGVVSVVFYKARRVVVTRQSTPRENHQMKGRQQQQQQQRQHVKDKSPSSSSSSKSKLASLPKNRRRKKRTHNKRPRNTIHLKEEGDPLAILHLHYRSVEWLKMIGHDIPEKINEEEHMIVEEARENRNDTQQLSEKQESATFSIMDIATYGWSRLKSMTRKIF
ncbi:9603_t:CDS:2 [Ambispora gerdemannii]|uniref:9603_t:CDS:1 n=1 Tax=Ambispora gerdemannii TaxID=144530 RepID=A0A9N8V3V8_9GLOM|nr:9603_t:CDS:2 [Ambispora gerdemannii]